MDEISKQIIGDKIEDQDLIMYLYKIIQLTDSYDIVWEESVSCNKEWSTIYKGNKYVLYYDKLTVGGVLIHEGEEITRLRGYVFDIIVRYESMLRKEIISNLINPKF